LLTKSGKIKPRKEAAAPVTEAPADDRPVDRLGRKMSPKAIQWKQWEEWCNAPTTSVKEINALRDSSPEFREFYNRYRDAELTPADSRGMYTPIQVALDADGFPAPTAVAVTPELREFAIRFKKLSVEEAKKLSKIAFNPDAAIFNANLEKASAAGLI
jgi:hypothetical protein